MRMGRDRLFLFLPVLALFLFLISGCALPKIVILKDPLTPEEHVNLGVAYEKKGELELAVRQYEAAAKKKLPIAYLYLGNAHLQASRTDEAERHYRKAISRLEAPEKADACNNLAWLYWMNGDTGRLEEAEALALEAIELNPSKKDIYTDTLEKIRQLRAAAAPK